MVIGCVGSYILLVRADLGFARTNVATFELDEGYGVTTTILEELEALEAVQSAAASTGTTPPLILAAYGGGQAYMQLRVSNRSDDGTVFSPATHSVSPAYFSTMGIRLVRGRLLTAADAGAPVAIVDEFSARTIFGDGRDPVGSQLWRGDTQPPLTIVGLVSSISSDGPEGGARARRSRACSPRARRVRPFTRWTTRLVL